MTPDLPFPRFRQVGNAAAIGAVLLLFCEVLIRKAAAAAQAKDYLGLTTCAVFQNGFISLTTFR